MVRGTHWKRNSVLKERPLQKGSSKSIRLPMLTDGPYNIAEGSSEGRGRKNEYQLPLHLPQYISCEGPESLVQREVGGRIEEGQGRKAPTVWEVKGKIVRKGLPEMPTIGQSIIEDPEDFWFDVKWTEESSHEAKKSQETGDWWETDDC